MCTLEVLYLGKTYTFAGDSITLADRLERQFGRITERTSDEAGTFYRTARDAKAWLYIG